MLLGGERACSGVGAGGGCPPAWPGAFHPGLGTSVPGPTSNTQQGMQPLKGSVGHVGVRWGKSHRQLGERHGTSEGGQAQILGLEETPGMHVNSSAIQSMCSPGEVSLSQPGS